MAAFYGHKRWEVDQLTDEEVSMYLAELPFIRFLRDFQGLRYAFGKFSKEDRQKMLEPASGPDDLHTRAWLKYTEPYGTGAGVREPEAEPLDIHPDTAEAIVAWIESGEFSRTPDSSRIWREQVMGLWPRLLRTAALRAG